MNYPPHKFKGSEPKKKLLYYLKVMQQARLEELAKVMKISRMAVHKHLAILQKRGLVEGIEKVLRERQSELFDQYYKRLKNLDFDKQVKELARIRDEEGYIAESKKEPKSGGGGKHVILEYNCPIIHIAEKHWEACTTETELFEKLLDADIKTTHRAAKGDLIC